MVLHLRGYSARIELGDAPLEEYAVEVKGEVISCYICSEEGKVRAMLLQVSCVTRVLTDQMRPQGVHSLFRR